MDSIDNQTTVIPIDQAQRALVVTETARLIERANSLFGINLSVIPVAFDLKGRAAGMYRMRKGKREIRFNPWLFSRFFESNFTDTIPHEVAHYVVEQLFGHQRVQPHGYEWQNIMIAFGCNPSVTCDYNMTGIPIRKVKRYSYQCACPDNTGHQLTSYRHLRIQRGQAAYRCQRCRQPLIETSPAHD